MKKKFAKDSHVVMNELVLPNDTNPLNNLMGGRLLHWMDIAGAISAQKHCDRVVVTASVDNVSFKHPVKLGAVITIEAQVTRAFNTSVEVRLTVWAQNMPGGTKVISNQAFYTFVAIDENSNTVKVPQLVPETEDEKEFYKSAIQRREIRLVLAGRLAVSEASELRSILNSNSNTPRL
ncbi:acyl-CoA thioesterase [Albibacterium indicum]|uniref:acyl-CoA thioesterase n=1 Tax=Albibacterium indicum TaxID=2292082 RepID=UPI000E500150|nr:acyl-CoA thioesterase [Pedobacter indicus]